MKEIINEKVKSKIVFLITENGSVVGNVAREEALQKSRDAGLDLVLISDKNNGQPPICKILDYGKMKYEEKKSRPKKKTVVTKEIRLRNAMNISDHDLETKHRQVRKFIEKGNKVKYVFVVRGRQRKMMDEAKDRLNKNLSEFIDIAIWTEPKTSNGTMVVLLSKK